MRIKKHLRGFINSVIRAAIAILAAAGLVVILLRFLPEDFVYTIAPVIGSVFGAFAVLGGR